MSFDQQQISRWIAMVATKPKKKSVAREVAEKASECKCLICGAPANGNRGLCVAHYLKFYRTLQELPRKDRAAFEQEQIEKGRVLAAGAIRGIKKPNPFATEVDGDE
ncbi:hypothetical protein SH449x_004077 [Pirellulaceae bacterium SH449]